jgi:hypothetical protein
MKNLSSALLISWFFSTFGGRSGAGSLGVAYELELVFDRMLGSKKLGGAHRRRSSRARP